MSTTSAAKKHHVTHREHRRFSVRGATTASAVAAIAAGVLVSASPAQASPAHRAHCATDVAATNTTFVLGFADALFNRGDLSVIDQDTDGYIQHNPTVADGPQGLRNLVVFLHGQFPNAHTTFERVVAQGDLVLLQDKVVLAPGGAAQQVIDIYRVEHHKIVEHWDNLQPVPDTTANGHDMFSSLSSPSTSSPSSPSATRRSERVATTYIRSLGARSDYDTQRLLALNLVQHDPLIADGARAMQSHYAAIFSANPQARYTVARVIAQGDLVAVHSHFQKSPADRGQSVVDIFRIRDGRIVEHWDGIQDVPATAANDNTMF